MVGNPSPLQEEAHSIFCWEVRPARGTSTNKKNNHLDPVGSTVRYEVAVLSHCEAVNDVIGSVEGIDAFIYYTKWRSGQVLPMPYGLTD